MNSNPADRLLEGLDPTQHAAVTSTAAPLAILAGAGSGKTRVLTRRIAWQSATEHIDPHHVLTVTFTRKAANELVSRLGKLGVQHQVTAGTFHSIALAQIRRRSDDRGRTMPKLLERKARILVQLTGAKGAEASVQASELATEIEWAKARLIRPAGYETAVSRARRTPPRPAGEVAGVYERYEKEKRKRGLLDFDDLIWWCADALESDESFAAVQRWRFRHLFVDEFQDVTPAQLRLVRAWLGPRTDLCVVGDPDQSIYGFAGADARMLEQFDQHFPGASLVRLGTNYRSSPEVVRTAESILPKTAAGAPPRQPSKAHTASGPPPTIACYANETEEAAAIAHMLLARHSQSRPWSSMAVLYRINAQSVAFEAALQRSGIPFRVRGASRFLERAEVRTAIDALRKTAKASPSLGFANHLADLTDDAAALPEERREHVDALVSLGHEYLSAEGGDGTLDGYLAYLDTALRGDAGVVTGDGVELLTFHRAKGLEFHTVFVTGLERGLVPIAAADTASQLSEERRLLYVALSRAERELFLSWCEQRSIGSRVMKRTASPYLLTLQGSLSDAAPAAVIPAVGGTQAARRALAQATTGRAGDATRKIDRGLYDKLVEWRRNMARGSNVPAYTVFHDSTLQLVAGNKPRSRDALLELAGVGPIKLERFGDDLLTIVREHDLALRAADSPA